MNFLLSVAGFDGTGGGGVLRDVATFRRFGFKGVAAITVNTVQNTSGVKRVEFTRGDFLIEQIETIVSEVEPKGVKVGIPHESLKVNEKLAEILSHFKPIVFDPVLSPTFGKSFLKDFKVISPLLEVADVLTPNCLEYEKLKELLKGFKGAVVVKGLEEKGKVKDLLVVNGEVVESILHEKGNREVRGTGCAFSSAFLSLLVLTGSLKAAFKGAVNFLKEYRRDSFKNDIMKQFYSNL